MTRPTEDDLRAALQADAGPAHATEARWDQVRSAGNRRHSRRRTRLVALGATVTVAAAAIAGALLVTDDDTIETTPPVASDPTTTTLPSPSTTAASPPAGASCSAGDLPAPSVPEGAAALGTPEATRAVVIAAAIACDYDALRTVMADQFTHSFGNPAGDPDAAITAWKDAEAAGEPIMRTLAEVLQTGVESRDDSGITRWQAAGDEYGYRAGITDDGKWVYFVAGD